MAIACLITVLPLDIESGARVPVRVCSAQDRSITGLNGVVWEPAVTLPPSLTINLWNGDFKTAVDPGSATFSINMETVKQSVPMADRYYWQGAPVEIRAEQIGQAWPWAIRFRGIVGSATRKKQIMAITANVDNSIFAQKVLTATFSGTGGIEGGSDIKNRLKPLILGYARNVEPILINADYSIYQFSSYGPIEAVTSLFERGSSFGPASGDYPDYASLEAANLPAGTWATCLARGLVRLGAPAYGVITGDVKGHAISGSTPRLTGAIIKAFAALAGIASENLIASSLDALDAAVPYPVNIVQTEQTTFIEIANQMALACNAQTGISLTGSYFVTPVTLDAPATLTLDARGRALPQVASSEELEVSPPYWKTILGANRSWRVHTTDEIAFAAALIDKGIYNATTTYREGNIVTREDGSQWIYKNATPSAGNPPPSWPIESNEWWANSIPPLSAANITYADGSTLEELKPAQGGATVGAPAGTPVGSTTADAVATTVTSTVPTLSAALAAAQAQIAAVLGDVAAAASSADAALAAIADEIARATGAEGTLSSQIYSLNTSVSGLSSSLNAEILARTDGQTALAASISSLSSAVSGNSASITSQSATLATLTSSTATIQQQLSAGKPNLLKNGSGEFGFAYWSSVSGSWNSEVNAWGPFFSCHPNASGGYFADSDPIPVWGGNPYTCAANSETSQYAGETDSVTRLELCWFANLADAQNNTNRLRLDYGPNVNRPWFGEPNNRAASKMTVTAPGDAGYVRVRIVSFGTNLQFVAFGAIKFEHGSIATPYSQEASLNQAYVTQQTDKASLASSISTLTANLGSLSSTVTVQASAIASLESRSGAYWGVTAVSGDNRASITLFANTAYSGFDIVGSVRISGSLLVNGTVTADSIEANGITAMQQAYNAGTFYGGAPYTEYVWNEDLGSSEPVYHPGVYNNVVSFSVFMDRPGDILAQVVGKQSYSGTIVEWQGAIVIDGTFVFVTGGVLGADSFSLMGRLAVGAGTHNVQFLWWSGGSTLRLLPGGASLMTLRRYR